MMGMQPLKPHSGTLKEPKNQIASGELSPG